MKTGICQWCGTEFSFNPSHHKNRNRKYCSVKCSADQNHKNMKGKRKVEWVSWNCLICGTEKSAPPSQSKNGKYCSRRCHCIGNFINMPTKQTGIELKISELLTDMNIKFEEQKLLNGITIVDFFVKPNIAIYVDGFYWHNRPEVKKRDAYFNKILPELGYKVIRLKENEINTNINAIKLHLTQMLGEEHASSIQITS